MRRGGKGEKKNKRGGETEWRARGGITGGEGGKEGEWGEVRAWYKVGM